MQTVHVTSAQLEAFAFDSGQTIAIRGDHAELKLGHHLFVAPLVPAQRKPGEGE